MHDLFVFDDMTRMASCGVASVQMYNGGDMAVLSNFYQNAIRRGFLMEPASFVTEVNILIIICALHVSEKRSVEYYSSQIYVQLLSAEITRLL